MYYYIASIDCLGLNLSIIYVQRQSLPGIRSLNEMKLTKFLSCRFYVENLVKKLRKEIFHTFSITILSS